MLLIALTLYPGNCRRDMTFAVDRALKANYLSILKISAHLTLTVNAENRSSYTLVAALSERVVLIWTAKPIGPTAMGTPFLRHSMWNSIILPATVAYYSTSLKIRTIVPLPLSIPSFSMVWVLYWLALVTVRKGLIHCQSKWVIWTPEPFPASLFFRMMRWTLLVEVYNW